MNTAAHVKYKIAILGDNHTNRHFEQLSHHFGLHHAYHIQNIHSLDIDAILLTHQEDKHLFDNINQIRQDQNLYLLPIITLKQTNHPGIDAILTDSQAITEYIHHIKELISQLEFIKSDWQARFLYFLYTRPNLKIMPNSAIGRNRFFYYPLVNAFISKQINTDPFEFIQDLYQQQVLKRTKLNKSFFNCSKCQSAHVYFSEQCPSCHSFDINMTDFIHCFSCGHISPETDFFYDGLLKCPNCRAKLKHISVDYDRPMENHVCNDCQHHFEEANIISTCMNCDNECSTDSLNKTNVHTYQLSDYGRKHIRENTDYTLSLFDAINYVKPEYFYTQLNWLLDMQQREKHYQFSLLGLSIAKTLESKRIKNVAETIKKTLRTTDVLTRMQDRIIWILLPDTKLEGAEQVSERILEAVTSEQLENHELQIQHISSTDFETPYNSKHNIQDLNERFL